MNEARTGLFSGSQNRREFLRNAAIAGAGVLSLTAFLEACGGKDSNTAPALKRWEDMTNQEKTVVLNKQVAGMTTTLAANIVHEANKRGWDTPTGKATVGKQQTNTLFIPAQSPWSNSGRYNMTVIADFATDGTYNNVASVAVEEDVSAKGPVFYANSFTRDTGADTWSIELGAPAGPRPKGEPGAPEVSIAQLDTKVPSSLSPSFLNAIQVQTMEVFNRATKPTPDPIGSYYPAFGK